jgi:hypothetical protein
MNAPARFFEREALMDVSRQQASNDAAIPRTSFPASLKTTALPYGFQDDAGNTVLLVDQSRQYHVDARRLGTFPDAPAEATAAGKIMAAEAVRLAREASARFSPAASNLRNRQRPAGATSWCDTPMKHRRMIAHLACLPSDISEKMDRDLTENEKTLLRAAAQDLYEGISGLSSTL